MTQVELKEDLLPTREDVRFFQDKGYWLGGKVLSDEQLDALRQAMEDVYAGRYETGIGPMAVWIPGDNPKAIRKSDNAHWASTTLRKLATNPTIGAMAARLIDTPEIRLWHDQLLYKPGQGSAGKQAAGNVGWHQDSHYWQCTITDLLTAWVAFDDVTLDNGCMQVAPGSHRWGLLKESDFFNSDLDAMKKKIEEETGHAFTTEPCTLKAGEVSFHHCLTIHGSGPNMTDKPRRSLVLHLQPDHAYYIAGTPSENHQCAILLRSRGGKNGDLFRGDYWPALYRGK
jgi:ectoine hydroxylase-related dioxygenase (phytanoyl-CoA dioxygenase family)